MNQFLDTSYWHFHINEGKEFDYNKIISLRKERGQLYKDFCKEQDYKKNKKLQWQIRKIDCDLAIEYLKR
jgi:hypothetical protein